MPLTRGIHMHPPSPCGGLPTPAPLGVCICRTILTGASNNHKRGWGGFHAKSHARGVHSAAGNFAEAPGFGAGDFGDPPRNGVVDFACELSRFKLAAKSPTPNPEASAVAKLHRPCKARHTRSPRNHPRPPPGMR